MQRSRPYFVGINAKLRRDLLLIRKSQDLNNLACYASKVSLSLILSRFFLISLIKSKVFSSSTKIPIHNFFLHPSTMQSQTHSESLGYRPYLATVLEPFNSVMPTVFQDNSSGPTSPRFPETEDDYLAQSSSPSSPGTVFDDLSDSKTTLGCMTPTPKRLAGKVKKITRRDHYILYRRYQKGSSRLHQRRAKAGRRNLEVW